MQLCDTPNAFKMKDNVITRLFLIFEYFVDGLSERDFELELNGDLTE